MNNLGDLRPETQEAVRQFLLRQDSEQSRVVTEKNGTFFIHRDGSKHKMTLQERVFFRAGLLKISGLERLYNREDQQGA